MQMSGGIMVTDTELLGDSVLWEILKLYKGEFVVSHYIYFTAVICLTKMKICLKTWDNSGCFLFFFYPNKKTLISREQSKVKIEIFSMRHENLRYFINIILFFKFVSFQFASQFSKCIQYKISKYEKSENAQRPPRLKN